MRVSRRAPPTHLAARRRARPPSRARGRRASRRRGAGRRSLLDECSCVAGAEEAHALSMVLATEDGGPQAQRGEQEPAHALRLARAAMLVEPAKMPAQVLDVETATVRSAPHVNHLGAREEAHLPACATEARHPVGLLAEHEK